jgi:hypothetical protein
MMFVTAKAPHTLQNMKRELSLADLEVSVAEPEQQPAIDAVVHKLLAVLAQAYVVRPVAHLSHSPLVHIVLHGLLHCCLQPGSASLQSHTHAAFTTASNTSLAYSRSLHTSDMSHLTASLLSLEEDTECIPELRAHA